MPNNEELKELNIILIAVFLLAASAFLSYFGGNGLTSITGYEVLNSSPCQISVNNDTNFTANISATLTATQSCIIVNASNIVIDCLGYALLGNTTGIGINNTGFTNITIRNCFIYNFTNNIMFLNVNASLITNTTLRNASGNGLLINASHNNTIANVTSDAAVSSPLNAIFIYNSTNNTLFNVTARNTNFAGIQFAISNNNTLGNSTGISDTSVGIYVYYSHNITIFNSRGSSNANASIFLKRSNATNITNSNGSNINGSDVDANGFSIYESHHGFFISNYAKTRDAHAFYIFDSTNNFFINNSVNATLDGGIYGDVVSNSTFANNTCYGSDGVPGLYVFFGVNNTISDNTGTSGGNGGININDVNNSIVRRNNGTGSDANGIVFNDMHNNEITGNYGSGVDFAGISIFVGSGNNNFTNNTGIGINDDGIQLGYDDIASFNNTFINNSGISTNFAGIGIQNGTGNVFINSTFESQDVNGFGIKLVSTSINNSFNNTEIRTNGTWISTGSQARDNKFSNISFIRPSGTLNIPQNFSVPNATNVTLTALNISSNNVFLNTTVASFLNRSAQIILRSLSFYDPRPIVDGNDDGVFETCNPPRCTEISYSGGTFIFNITGFSSYSSQETPEANGVGSSNGKILGGVGESTIIKPKEQETCVSDWACEEWGACSDGSQVRTCTDVKGCNDLNSRPAIEKRCKATTEEQEQTNVQETGHAVNLEQPSNIQESINAIKFAIIIALSTIAFYIWYAKKQG